MLTVIGSVVGTMVGMSVLVGLLIRYALVPYMRGQLVDPIALQLGSIIQLANEAVNQVNIISRAWDGHIDWSQREVDRLWEQMLIQERMIRRQGERHDTEDA